MKNPFAEQPGPPQDDAELVRQAASGDRASVEALVLRHQAWVFNICVRMMWDTERAQDATQEILIKILTGLPGWKGESAFRTWAYRIAVNHVLNVRRSPMEEQGVTFTELGRGLDETPDRDLPDPASVPVDLPVLVEEAKVGCTMAMLMCLDRPQRLAFTLGEVLGVSDEVGAELLETTPANFRQILSRARRDLYRFMNGKCGLVNRSNPCRCARKTRSFMEKGYLDPGRIQFNPARLQAVREVAPDRLRDLQELTERHHAEVFRSHAFLPVPDQAAFLRQVLADPRFRHSFNFDS